MAAASETVALAKRIKFDVEAALKNCYNTPQTRAQIADIVSRQMKDWLDETLSSHVHIEVMSGKPGEVLVKFDPLTEHGKLLLQKLGLYPPDIIFNIIIGE